MMERNEAIIRIKSALKTRTGKTWSVTGGKGTAWGWIAIKSPPARRGEFGSLSAEDLASLEKIFGRVHHQGISIPASSDYRKQYVAQAEGRTPEVYGTPYWD